jgi:predicted oxidoreductase
VTTRLIYGLGNSKNFILRGQSFLRRVVDSGISHFDVAPIYGGGLGELLVGNLSKKHRIFVTSKMGVDSWKNTRSNSLVESVSTKFVGKLIGASNARGYTPDFLQMSINRSLGRLGNHFEESPVFLLHELNPNSRETPQAVDFLTELKAKGIIKDYGIATSRLQNSFDPSNFPIIQTNFEHAFGLSNDKAYQKCELRAYGLFRNFSNLSEHAKLLRLEQARIFLKSNSLNKIVVGTSNINNLIYAIERLNV